jgi:hypothetical protein
MADLYRGGKNQKEQAMPTGKPWMIAFEPVALVQVRPAVAWASAASAVAALALTRRGHAAAKAAARAAAMTIRRRMSFANVASMVALVVALSGGTAYAASFVVSSNTQVAPNTIAGHRPPPGATANLMPQSVAASELAPAGPWLPVGAANRQVRSCADGIPLQFCAAYGEYQWVNTGGPFAPAAVMKDITGRVLLRGLVTPGGAVLASPAPLLLLPAGYRPAHELVFSAVWNDRNGSYLARVDVTSDGRVER